MSGSAVEIVLKNAASAALPRQRVQAICDQVASVKRRAQALSSLDDGAAAAQDFAQRRAQAVQNAAALELRVCADATVKENALAELLANAADKAQQLEALLVGTLDPRDPSGASIDAQAKAMEAECLGALQDGLRRAGVFEALRLGNDDFDCAVANELARLSAPQAGRDTRDAAAKRTAQVLFTVQEGLRQRLNEAGAWVGPVPCYLARQAHDWRRIAAAGFEAWYGAIEPLLDPLGFDAVDDADGDDARAQFLHGIWRDLAANRHATPVGMAWGQQPHGSTPAAQRLQRESQLMFKDADSWWDYATLFGAKSLYAAIGFGIWRACRSIALLRRLSADTEAVFGRLCRRLKIAEDRVADLRLCLERVACGPGRAADPSLPAIAAARQASVAVSRWGGDAFDDVPAQAASLKHDGVGFLRSFDQVTEAFFDPLPEGTRGKAQRVAAAALKAGIGMVWARFAANDGAIGAMSTLQDRLTRAGLLAWWRDALEAGMGQALAQHLAQQADRKFADLPQALRHGLIGAGIVAPDWDALRGNVVQHDGVAFLLAEGEEQAARKLREFYRGRVARAFAAADGNAPAPDDTIDAALQFVAYFKAYPVAYANRRLARLLLDRPAPQDDKIPGQASPPGVVHLMMAATVFDHLVRTMTDLAAGIALQNPDSEVAWDAAMRQGANGLYADFLLGQYRDMMRDRTRQGSLQSAPLDPQDAVDSLRNGRKAVNYLFCWQIADSLNPGFVQRIQDMIERQRQDEPKYMLSPAPR